MERDYKARVLTFYLLFPPYILGRRSSRPYGCSHLIPKRLIGLKIYQNRSNFVKKPIDKQARAGLVVGWVTTSESPVLYVFFLYSFFGSTCSTIPFSIDRERLDREIVFSSLLVLFDIRYCSGDLRPGLSLCYVIEGQTSPSLFIYRYENSIS